MKRFIAFLLIITLVLSIYPIDLIYATGIIDYRTMKIPSDVKYKPMSGLRLYIKRANGTNQNLDSTGEYKIGQATVGDRIEARDISVIRSQPLGTNIDRWDFQYVKPDGTEIKIDKAGSQYGLIQEITLDQPGKWEFYLSVRDNARSLIQPNWDNWSDNGNHRAIKELPDGQQFYWYFVRMDIQVEDNSKPNAEFEIHYQGIDKTDNFSNPVEVEKYPVSASLLDRSTADKSTITGWTWERKLPNGSWQFLSSIKNPTATISQSLETFRLKVRNTEGKESDWVEHSFSTKLKGENLPPAGSIRAVLDGPEMAEWGNTIRLDSSRSTSTATITKENTGEGQAIKVHGHYSQLGKM